MTATSRIPVLVRRWLVCLALTVPLAACAHHQVTTLALKHPECLSDEGAVRACLVPEKDTDGKPNKQVTADCYWLDQKDPREYRRKNRDNRPRHFSFSVVNKCSKSVEVQFLLRDHVPQVPPDTSGHLEFLTKRCQPKAGPDGWAELAKVTIGADGGSFDVACTARPYKSRTGAERKRGFNLVATQYDERKIDPPVPFDPEVVLEKAGGET